MDAVEHAHGYHEAQASWQLVDVGEQLHQRSVGSDEDLLWLQPAIVLARDGGQAAAAIE
jgi:hypothetical protein